MQASRRARAEGITRCSTPASSCCSRCPLAPTSSTSSSSSGSSRRQRAPGRAAMGWLKPGREVPGRRPASPSHWRLWPSASLSMRGHAVRAGRARAAEGNKWPGGWALGRACFEALPPLGLCSPKRRVLLPAHSPPRSSRAPAYIRGSLPQPSTPSRSPLLCIVKHPPHPPARRPPSRAPAGRAGLPAAAAGARVCPGAAGGSALSWPVPRAGLHRCGAPWGLAPGCAVPAGPASAGGAQVRGESPRPPFATPY